MFNIAPALEFHILIHFMLRKITQQADTIRYIEFHKKLNLFYQHTATKSHSCHCTDIVRHVSGIRQLRFVHHRLITVIVIGTFPFGIAVQPKVETRSHKQIRPHILSVPQVIRDRDSNFNAVHGHGIIHASESRRGIAGQKLGGKDLIGATHGVGSIQTYRNALHRIPFCRKTESRSQIRCQFRFGDCRINHIVCSKTTCNANTQ